MIYETFHTNNLDLADRKVVIGVSGGVDSVVLLHLCHRLGTKISVVHVNYGLRDEDSDTDEAFTQEYCNILDVPCFVTRVNGNELMAKGVNLQQTAREIRYQAYFKCKEETGSDYILTAHHNDDSIETVIMNFFRGTNLPGLTGIKNRDSIRRPLLAFTKSDILDYARASAITYREDKSNATDYYTRNRIRNTILPQLEATFPNVKGRLNKTIINLRATERSHQIAMDSLLLQAIQQTGKDQILPFDFFDENLEQQVLVYWGNQHGMSRAQMLDLYSIRDRVGKKVESNTHEIIIDRDGYLAVMKGELPIQETRIAERGFEILLPEIGIKFTDDSTQGKNASQSIQLDDDKLIFPLKLRHWNAGDRIQYSQSPDFSKKLKKLFNDHKVKRSDKQRIPILVNGDNCIIWVLGLQKNPIFLSDTGYSIFVIDNE